jgi:hypothetical protein
MLLDILACVPIDVVFWETSYDRNSNNLIRLLRLPRLYRLIKVTKIYKSILSKKSSLDSCRRIYEYVSIRTSAVRFISAIISVLLLAHNMACLWYFSARVADFSPDTWVFYHGHMDSDTSTLYLACLYWSLSTMTTVGYGDVSAHSSLEHLITTVWMIGGVFIFSFTIGALSSIMGNMERS